MNAIELMKEFAKSQGINVKEVDKFLSKYDNPMTLEELSKLPHDVLNHESYISWVNEPLKSFITDDMWRERYETIALDTIIDCLEDRRECLNIIDKEEDREKARLYDEIEEQLIDTKFGSVVYDW